MRYLSLCVVGLCIFLAGMWTAQGQNKKPPDKPPDKKPPEKKENPPKEKTEITEIGGKGIEQWIKEIPSRDRSRSERAIRTVLLFGPAKAYEALPAILHELEKHKPPSYPLDTSIRVNATIALGLILGGVKDPETKYVKEAVRILTRLLRDSQSIVRYRAVEALGLIGADARSAVSELVNNSIKDPNTWETRQAAATALGLINIEKGKGPPTEVIKALIAALADSSFQVRLAAIKSITWVGAPGDKAIKSQMVNILEDRVQGAKPKEFDSGVRIWIHMAIMSIRKEVLADHTTAIAKMVKHPEMMTRSQMVAALGVIGAEPEVQKKSKDEIVKIVVPTLCTALGDEQAEVRAQSAATLGRIGPIARKAVPPLIKGLNDSEPTVAFVCMWALTRMEGWGEPALPALKTIVADPKRSDPLKKAAASAIDILTGKNKEKEKKPKGE
jgi:HEAT repeat protein